MANFTQICEYIVIGAGGAATLTLTPVLLAFLGFTAAGIAAGSIAAKLMSMFAILNGGGVVAGGLVALLQSLGTGLSWGASFILWGLGSTLGTVVSKICNRTVTVIFDESLWKSAD
ncbi:interferon alpha-inducible protein 27-like protein 2A [Pholidichthys leucotaenia]